MQKLSIAFALLFANVALGLNYSRAQGTQFITGACTSDKDCASDCCGFRTGKCAGPVIAQERDGGCGFGEAQSNDRAAVALGFAHRAPISTTPFTPGAQNNGAAAPAAPGTPAPATGSGKPAGTQFITGVCANDGECASKCCGFKSGKCAGPIVAQERDGGCGFGDPQPNDTAARELGFKGPSPAQNNGAAPPAAPTPATGSGKAPGTQFITGACANDGECASACCGFRTGKCAGPIVAQERDGGCGFGDAQPNDRAAKALRGRADPERYLL